MAEPLHPAASHQLPSFITAPGETDVLMVVMSAFLLLSVLAFGVLFFRLHTLPERIAHKSEKIQFEIVAVLGLISLFTHMHIFWIIGLLLALIDLPDFSSLLGRIAGSVEQIAGVNPETSAADMRANTLADVAGGKPEISQATNTGNGGAAVSARPERTSANKKS
jgi:hypothetical protein